MSGADRDKVLVIPCSGVGKVHGLMSREAAYLAVDELAPDETGRGLPGSPGAGRRRDPRQGAGSSLHHHRRLRQGLRPEERGDRRRRGGRAPTRWRRPLSKHRGAQPGNGSELTEEGWAITREIAEPSPRRPSASARAKRWRDGGRDEQDHQGGHHLLQRRGDRRGDHLPKRRAPSARSRCARTTRSRSACPCSSPATRASATSPGRIPTITIDGCDKLCARWGTEKHGGPVARSLVVSDILGEHAARCSRSLRGRSDADEQAIAIVADRIAAEIDALMSEGARPEMAEDASADVCACMKPVETGSVSRQRASVWRSPRWRTSSLSARRGGIRADAAAGPALARTGQGVPLHPS